MIKEHSWLEDGRHTVAGTSGSTHLSSGQEDRVGQGRCPHWSIAFNYSATGKDTKRIKRHGATDSQESRAMNKIQATNLFVAVFTFLAVLVCFSLLQQIVKTL